jgi:hypothetical protein
MVAEVQRGGRMRLVEKHIIRKSHKYWKEIDDLSFLT